MKKSEVLSLMMVLFLIVIPIGVHADVDAKIDIKTTFREGELVSFRYRITSTEDANIGYVPYVYCPKATNPILSYKTMFLEKDATFSDTYEYIEVTEDLEPQSCVAYVEIRQPDKQKFEENFTIDTSPSIIFRILTCTDLSCERQSKTFLKNEEIYIDYESDVPYPDVTSVLTYPDETSRQLTLPGSVSLDKIGTYTLRVTASKEGYKTVEKSIQFGVISKKADIKTTGEVSGIVWWGWLEGIKTSYILIIVFVIAVFSITTLFLRGKLKSLSR